MASNNKMKLRFVVNRNGKQVALLNPNGKGRKYAHDLRTNKKHTNTGQVKKNYLTKEERAYRSGYLKAREDIGKASASVRGIKKRQEVILIGNNFSQSKKGTRGRKPKNNVIVIG